MCMRPHPWTSSRCCQVRNADQHRCSPSYSRVLTWVVPSGTSNSSPRHCTSCSSNTQTTSCTYSCQTNGHSKETTNCSCSAESIHWKCHKGDQVQHALPLTNQPESGSPRPGFLRRCDPARPWLMNISNISCIFQINHITHLLLLVLKLK